MVYTEKNSNISAVIPFAPVNLAGNRRIQGERAVATSYRSIGPSLIQGESDPSCIQGERLVAPFYREKR